MCIALPMRVEVIDGNMASVEHGGMSWWVRIDFLPDVRVGDYVLVHAGIAIERVRPECAEETLNKIRSLTDDVR